MSTFTLTRICTTFLVSLLIFSACKQPAKNPEISADPKIAALKLPEGFRADHLFGPSENGEGSWVAMSFDDKGRLITSDQYGALYRMTIPVIGDTSQKVTTERLMIPSAGGQKDSSSNRIDIGYAHGLLYAFNSLYVMVNHHSDSSFPRGSGLYRLQDTDQDDQFDKITLLKALDGEGEHGPHSIVLAPDGKSLFVIAGNFTRLPPMNKYRIQPAAQLDNLIPLYNDPNGHDNGVPLHGGWIANLDSSGTNWELYASGFRNPFDLAFNGAGDLFTYDSDMEWDMGTPWYRPTRICHVTSGAEFGWRPGTAKWNAEFSDGRPAMLNIGQGSPTNLIYGSSARFPEKYRKSLFAFDWSFGIIYAIQMEASGSSYTAKGEEFISGAPLPLTDGVIGPDGALYFLTGGRRLESDLYRVYYGDGQLEIKTLPAPTLNEANQLRRNLEKFHTQNDLQAIELAWPNLRNEDAGIRYAARKVLEHQPLAGWKSKLENEKDPVINLQAALALAKKTGREADPLLVINLLTNINFNALDNRYKLDHTRASEVVLSRNQHLKQSQGAALAAYYAPYFPVPDQGILNRQLSKLLVYLEEKDAVSKSLAVMMAPGEDMKDSEESLTSGADLILRNPQYGMDIANMLAKLPPQKQTFYATVLSNGKTGWNEELQDKYFKWYYAAFQFSGGYSYRGFINQARKAALQQVNKEKFAYFNQVSGDSISDRSMVQQAGNAVQPNGPGRDWTTEQAMKYIDSGMGKRDFTRGKGLFVSSLCASCHMMNGEGGVSGPDLTQLGTRFSYQDMLESILEPSKTISDQFGATVFFLNDGKSVVGRLIEENDTAYIIAQNPFAPQQHRAVERNKVIRTRLSDVSPMLPGMINRLNPEEMKDLLAFLKSGGNKEDSLFTGKPSK